MDETDPLLQITGKKPRKPQRQLLAQYTNDQLARLVGKRGSLAKQLQMLVALERLYRKANAKYSKNTRFSIGRLQGLVPAVRPREVYAQKGK